MVYNSLKNYNEYPKLNWNKPNIWPKSRRTAFLKNLANWICK